MSQQYVRLIKNIFWITLGGSLSKIVSFVMLPLYTRWLSPADYGIGDIISVYATLLMGVSTLCIAEAMFVFPKGVEPQEQKKYFSTGLFFTALLLAVLGVLACGYTYYADCHNFTDSFSSYVWYIYALVITNFLQVFTQQFACALNALKVYSLTGLVHSLGLALFAVWLIPKYGAVGYIRSLILSNIVGTLFTFVFSSSYKYCSWCHISAGHFRRLAKYSIPLIPNSLIWWVVYSLNRPLLEEYAGLAAIGIYAVASKLPSVLNMAFAFFAQSWQVSVFEEYKKESFTGFFNNVFKAVCLGLMLLAILITMFRNGILTVITTPEYYEATNYIPLLSFGLIFSCISAFVGSLYAVNKKSRYFFYSSVWGALFTAVLNFVLIPLFDTWGAVFASAVSMVIICLVRIYYAKMFVRFQDFGFYVPLIVAYIIYLIVDHICSPLVVGCLMLLAISLVLAMNKKSRLLFHSLKLFLKKKIG